MNLLDEVDVISSVSGGSIAAAYDCITADEGEEKASSGRRWNRDSVRDQMSKNYQMRWIGNWFWPWNIARYWFTAYDRADIMAKTFSDNWSDSRIFGWELTFEDLNPERPYLLINATDATQHKREELHFGEVFTFTTEDFTDKLGSDIERYSVGRAVMASACFPSAFAYMTLRDYRQEKKREHVHVFDGGNADDLGLASLSRLIMQLENGPPEARPDRYVVISIDAFTDPPGVNRHAAAPRNAARLPRRHEPPRFGGRPATDEPKPRAQPVQDGRPGRPRPPAVGAGQPACSLGPGSPMDPLCCCATRWLYWSSKDCDVPNSRGERGSRP